MIKKFIGGVLGLGIAFFSFEACSPAKGDHPGHEYMPDMAHSIAYEANRIDEYSLHTWDKQSTKTLVDLWGTPRLPVKGTIPRGYVGVANNSDALVGEMTGQNKGIYTPMNGNVPYYYADTEEDRARATKDIVMNPFPITKSGLTKGKELFQIYCGICHGEKGGGNGYLVSDENANAKYPAQPANLLLDTFVNGNIGRLYHAIIYGKNVMGGYTDKLSYEERWQVIHYILACQAETKKLEYNEKVNSFKPQAAITEASYLASMAAKKAATSPPKNETPKGGHEGENHSNENHSGGQHK